MYEYRDKKVKTRREIKNCKYDRDGDSSGDSDSEKEETKEEILFYRTNHRYNKINRRIMGRIFETKKI